jgi:HSP20 family molecular chaperone IbpA
MTEIEVKKSDDTKETFREKISDLLEEMWEKIGQHHHCFYATPGKLLKPETDLSEDSDAFTYQLELPGMDEEDVEVEIGSGQLSIRGEKRDEKEEKGENYIFRERRYGSFERRFMLPENVKVRKVKANFEKGVLTVTIPYEVSKESKPTKIEVNAD